MASLPTFDQPQLKLSLSANRALLLLAAKVRFEPLLTDAASSTSGTFSERIVKFTHLPHVSRDASNHDL